MIEKFFFKKKSNPKSDDPISSYVNNLCSLYNKCSFMDIDLYDAEFSVIDTETTGLDIGSAKIINLAAVKIKNFKIIDFYDSFINPGMKIPEESIKWHHITDDMVEDKPLITEVIPEFLRFVNKSIIVGHHINFDVKMINKEMKENFGCELSVPVIDTMFVYTRAIVKRNDHVGLDYLFDVYKVKCNGRHTALGDALATAEVFNKMIIQASANFKKVKELYRSQAEIC